MGTPDLNDIALFTQVVRAGSFAEAARRLGMPSNTLSRRIRQLEEALGARLLHRSTRKLALTEAGTAFHARCTDPVEALSEAATEIVQDSAAPGGKVRVAAPANFFDWFQMEWISEFLREHPRVQLEFMLSDARADLVAESIDVALRADKLFEPGLVARRIGIGRQSMVATPGYLAARGMPASPDELSAHDCIIRSPAPLRASWQLDGPQGSALLVVPVSGRFHANSTQVLLQAALAGLGIALLPDMMTAPHVHAGRLAPVLPSYGVAAVDVRFVYLSRRQLPRAVRAFVESTMAKMRESGLIQSM